MFFKKLIKRYLVFKIVSGIIFLTPVEIDALADGDQKYRYVLVVDISTRQISLLENGNKLFVYPVGVPKYVFYKDKLPAVGELVRIEMSPIWYPTQKTRDAYFKKKGVELPEIVGPFERDPRNAMGKVKFVVKFNRLMDTIRIHGTNEPGSIGKKISRGCIRMHNENILDLADTIGNQKTKVIIKND
jgi:lipoprotein-anchoring transpeptidase ErfK/SrfK